jgi:hypothetical protein
VKVKAVVLVSLVAAVLTVFATAAYASCSMAAGQAASAARVVEEELVRLAPWKPGSNARDVVWLKENLVELVPDWLPETKRLAEHAEPEMVRVVDDCYRPADYSTPSPVRSGAVACVKKAALAQLTHARVADWTAVCGEVGALDGPAGEAKIRAWTREWVDKYIEYARNR